MNEDTEYLLDDDAMQRFIVEGYLTLHFCAALPNFRIMEIDIDDVPWKDDLVTHPPEIVDGHLLLSDRPGWGCDIDEDAVKAHPPQ